jgi:hypothetical protein
LPDTPFRLDAAVLHDLIRLWLERNPPLYDEESYYIGDLESLRYQEGLDVQNGQGHCFDVANQFSEFIRSELNLTNPDIQPYVFTPNESTWKYFGYTDRPELGNDGDDSHTMTLVVDNDGEIYGIDWTSAQYGSHEFPMVLHLVIDSTRLGPVVCGNDIVNRYNYLWMGDEPPGTWERLTIEELGVTPISL